MNGIVTLTPFDLSLAALLIVPLAGLSLFLRLGLVRALIVAALRTVIQLILIGLVLKAVFANSDPVWITLIATIMLIVAGRELMSRQQRRFKAWWGFGLGTSAMFVPTFTVTVLVLLVIIQQDPWYAPQYAIPLLGMMLGNTMNGIALGLDRLTQQAWQQRAVIEARLALGQDAHQAMADIRRDSV